MSRIDDENAKRIRTPMDITVSIGAKTPQITLTDTITSGSGYTDSNFDSAIDTDSIPMLRLADLAGSGFSLIDGCVPYDASRAADETGKVGIRTGVGAAMTVHVTSTVEFAAVTIHITSGSGKVTASGKAYTLYERTVIPVNAKTVDLVFTPDSGVRLEICSIVSGMSVQFTNDDIISCTVGLRSDLSMVNPSWGVSEIEVQAYWPEDISTAIANMSDDEPITYSAGYAGDMSEERQFYLSEPAQMDGNVITIKGEDRSAKLDDVTYESFVRSNVHGQGKKEVYSNLSQFVRDSGIVLKKKESDPAKTTNTAKSYIVYQSQSAREAVQMTMNLTSADGFYPRFVDAGIPSLSWSKPSVKWNINEEDIGDEVKTVDRNLAALSADGETKFNSTITLAGKKTVAKDKKITKGQIYTITPNDGNWASWSVTNGSIIYSDASKVKFKATATSKKTTTYVVTKRNGKKYKKKKTVYKPTATVKARHFTISGGSNKVIDSDHRAGTTSSITPSVNGRVYQDSSVIFPNWKALFERDNRTISFTCKGDPRWQPRDILRIHWIDGGYQDITLEEIQISHSEGGTTASVKGRYGII